MDEVGKCPTCERVISQAGDSPSDHHLIPQCRENSSNKVTICESCHLAIHQLFSNKELESIYNSVDALLVHETFAKTAKFIGKQNGRVITKLANSQKQRRRNG